MSKYLVMWATDPPAPVTIATGSSVPFRLIRSGSSFGISVLRPPLPGSGCAGQGARARRWSAEASPLTWTWASGRLRAGSAEQSGAARGREREGTSAATGASASRGVRRLAGAGAAFPASPRPCDGTSPAASGARGVRLRAALPVTPSRGALGPSPTPSPTSPGSARGPTQRGPGVLTGAFCPEGLAAGGALP